MQRYYSIMFYLFYTPISGFSLDSIEIYMLQLTQLQHQTAEIFTYEHEIAKRAKSNRISIHLLAPIMILAALPAEDVRAVPVFQSTTQSVSYKLSDSNAFKLLPREPTRTKSAKELQDLKELEDDRLDKCVDKGIFWEQCFIFGESDKNGDDSMRTDNVNRMQKGTVPARKTVIPTW